MLRTTTTAPPGFWEIATDPDLPTQLGLARFGALIRLCQLSGPIAGGAWAVPAINQIELARTLGVSPPTLRGIIEDLVVAGLILIKEGESFGPHRGKSAHQILLTWTLAQTGPGEESLQERNLREKTLPAKTSGTMKPPPPQNDQKRVGRVLLNESKNTSSATHPLILSRALAKIRWTGPFVPPPGIDVEQLVALIDDLVSRPGLGNPAGFLRWLLADTGRLDSELASTPGLPRRESRPAWCGVCDERTRQRVVVGADGVERPARCPVCGSVGVGVVGF